MEYFNSKHGLSATLLHLWGNIDMSVVLIILEFQFMTVSKEVPQTGTDKSTGTVALDRSSVADTPYSFLESLTAVKVTVRAHGWPMTQILKQGPTVALASVSSNLPTPQRHQTNWLASGA